jgi:Co/Zn/Cd efflux system component
MGKGTHGGHGHNSGEERETFIKAASFWIIGVLTLAYCLVELYYAVTLESLTLLSDGFHNLSDVASLYIAYWALKVSIPDVRLVLM